MTKFNRRLLVLVAPLLLVALAACKSVIPDQQVTDPFGLDDRAVPVVFEGSAAVTSLAPQAVTGQAHLPFTFNDFEQSLPISPTAITNDIRAARAVLHATTGPETITLSGLTLRLRGWQGEASYDEAAADQRAEISLTSDAEIVLSRGACTTTCEYSIASGANLGTLSMSGGPLTNFLRIATTAPTTNSAVASITVVAEEDELAGMELEIILGAADGMIVF